MKSIKPIALSATFMALASLSLAQDAKGYEGVIFFPPIGEGAAMSSLRADYIDELSAVADSLKMEFQSADVVTGLPKEITTRPAIVYQNAQGRSIFQGRYADLGKVRHFLMTSRSIPQGSEMLNYQDAYLLDDGRSKTVAKIKITEVNGQILSETETDHFLEQARLGIAKGLYEYTLVSSVDLQRTDRVFYFDFYPYLSDDGTVYLGSALYSLFNCHVPITKYTNDPTVNSSISEAFKEAAERLLTDQENAQTASKVGDAYEPVADSVPMATWEELGFPLPPALEGVDYAAVDATVPMGSWVLDPEQTFDGAIKFQFPAPLDRYQGIANAGSAELVLSDSVNNTGLLTVPTNSITMGESDLDYTVRNEILRVAQLPEASFALESFDPAPKDLKFGRPFQTVANGTFTMRKTSIPLSVLVEMTPILSGDGDSIEEKSRLAITTSWDIRLKEPFGISGPDGPEEARDTVKFFADFMMKPEG